VVNGDPFLSFCALTFVWCPRHGRMEERVEMHRYAPSQESAESAPRCPPFFLVTFLFLVTFRFSSFCFACAPRVVEACALRRCMYKQRRCMYK